MMAMLMIMVLNFLLGEVYILCESCSLESNYKMKNQFLYIFGESQG